MADRRVALVTGGARNIGREICLSLGRRGFDVVVNTRSDLARADDVVRELEQFGRAGHAVVADVSRPEQARGLVAATLERFGRCDAIVNNAALRLHGQPFLEIADTDWQVLFDTNVRAAFHICQAAFPGMIERGSGAVVNISGSVAFEGSERGAHVAASKAAILGLTKALAREFGPAGIRVNAVVPSLTDTDRATPLPAGLVRSLAEKTALGRIGRPSEVAEVCAFLVSDESSYVTGQSIHVNGGLLMS